MSEVYFAVPGDLTTLTGGYAYARRLMEALPAAGWPVCHIPLPASFPNPTAADLSVTRAIFAQLPKRTPILIDGLAFGALPQAFLDTFDLTYVGLVHHPLAAETGLSAAHIERLQRSEQAALGSARAVIATSPFTADALRHDYGVGGDKLFVAVPGTDPAPRVVADNAVPQLLTVATLTHRKGHDVLIQALRLITDLPWRSVLVGSLDRDPKTAAMIRTLIQGARLQGRIALRGELDGPALQAAYANADLFVLPSRHEGYGMVFAEALARGLPIVACAAGAVVGTVPADAGLLVPPDDPDALADSLRRVLSDASLRKTLGDAAWKHGQTLPTWNDTAVAVAKALQAAMS